jgi:hypothetical protein
MDRLGWRPAVSPDTVSPDSLPDNSLPDNSLLDNSLPHDTISLGNHALENPLSSANRHESV